ncbi:host cell factor isoform X3 [Amblyomma americanum]
MAAPILKWKRVTSTTGPAPRPRHGHRAVAIKDLMIVFGGGNEGIVDELHVYNTSTNQWFVPPVKGDIPPGCAAYGFVCDGTRLLVFGGMVEYGKYSNELYELQASRWEWKRLKPRPPRGSPGPCPRLGHSFTLIGNKAFLFGGLANDSDDPKNNIPRRSSASGADFADAISSSEPEEDVDTSDFSTDDEDASSQAGTSSGYLNDLYTLELRPFSSSMAWDVPQVFGQPPPPRESHTAVAYQSREGRQPRLIVYGGMSGCRLGDLWQLDVDSMSWSKPQVGGVAPLPRSLHSATLIGQRMFVFGGWVPLVMDENKASTHEKEWKCTNTLASLNLETMAWEPLAMEVFEDSVPRARAGHCSVAINSRLYIWSGRDGYRKAWNNQVCCKDLWYLETEKPPPPSRVQLVRASTATLEVCWGAVPTADAYLLQLQRYDVPPTSTVPPPPVAPAAPVAPPAPATPVAPAPVAAATPTPAVAPPIASPKIITPTQLRPVRTPGIAQPQTPTQSPAIRVPAAASLASGLRGTVTLVRTRSPGGAGQQQIRVIATTPTGQHVVKTVTGNLPTVTQPQQQAQQVQQVQQVAVASPAAATTAVSVAGQQQPMSGMAALAAAAAATQKMTTATSTTAAASPTSAIRVVSPSVLAQQGLKISSLPIQGSPTGGAAVRLAAPGTLLKTGTAAGGKQIITVHKGAAATSQPQIVTLVKTTQGVTLATMPKVSLIQQAGKASPQGKVIPQGATIVKLVTTQAGGTPGKPTLITTSQTQQQPTLLGLTGAAGSPKVTILRTLPSNMVTVAKAGSPASVATVGSGGKQQQTIVIAAPKAGGQPGTTKLLTQAGAKAGAGGILVVTTHPQGKATVVGTAAATVEAGKGAKTTSVNVLPLSAGGQLNSVTSPSGVKMIVVSSAGLTGQQAFTLLTTAAGSRPGLTQLTSSSAPITITMPAGRGRGATAGGGQIVALPAQGLLPSGGAITIQTKPGVSPAQKVLTIVTTTGSTSRPAAPLTVVTQALSGSLPAVGGKVMLMAAASQPDAAGGGVTYTTLPASALVQAAAQPAAVDAVLDESDLQGVPMETDADSTTDPAAMQSAQALLDTMVPVKITAEGVCDDGVQSAQQACTDGVHCGTPEPCTDGIHCGTPEPCTDGIHCGTPEPCTDGIHCGTPEPCTDGIHCGTPEPCADGIHCGTPEPCTDGIHCGTPEPCTDGIHCGTPEPCADGIHCGTPEPCTDGIHCGTPEPCTDGIHCGTPEPCADGIHCGTPEPCMDGIHCGTPEPCTDGIHCGTPKPCADGIHCGTPEPCTDGIHCGTPEPCTDGIHCGTPEPCTDGIHCGTPEPCTDGVHCGTPKPCTDGIHCGTPEPCTDGVHCGTPKHCTDGIHCGTPEPDADCEMPEQFRCGSPEPDADYEMPEQFRCGSPEPPCRVSPVLQNKSLLRPVPRRMGVCVVACSDQGEGSGEANGNGQPPPSENSAPPDSGGGGEEPPGQGDNGEQPPAPPPPPAPGGGGGGDEPPEEDQNSGTPTDAPADTPEQEEEKKAGGENEEESAAGGLSLETPGALPPDQMCVDDPPPQQPQAQLADHAPDGAVPGEAEPAEAAVTAAAAAAAATTAVAATEAAVSTGAAATTAAAVMAEAAAAAAATTAAATAAATAAPATVAAVAAATAEPSMCADPLTTLASAAVSTASSTPPTPAPALAAAATTNGLAVTIKTEEDIKPVIDTKPATTSAPPPSSGSKRDGLWYDVGVFKETSCLVSHFYLPSEQSEQLQHRKEDADVDVVSIGSHAMLQKQELQPGTAYKFRVAAINACGRGPWSEVSAFKTCLPGYPGAPSAIKISKGPDGAHLSWEAPQGNPGDVTEYSVYLAVRSATTCDSAGPAKTVTSNPSQLAFVRVYCGPQAACTVATASLASAHVDTTSKPAIIFRIAARNDKGYGPATQVRWLQDGVALSAGRGAGAAAKRPAADGKGTPAKKIKSEDS